MTTKTLSTWLKRIDKPESWLYPKLSQLSNQELILDRDVVIKRIVKAIRSGELIVCYGDYDLDGTGSTCILTDCIRQCGGRVSTLLASRFNGGGYGFNDIACDKVIASGAKLVVTMDCGSADHDRFERLIEHGIDALVLDHHLIPPRPLPKSVLGFLNPHREGCQSEFKWACSGGLSLSVAGGILRELGIPRSQIDPLQWLEICALATIGDVAPLESDNRILTRLGLEAISNSKLPGIRALMELAKISAGSNVTARDCAFRIAPAINAPGRLQDPDIIIDLLLSKDIDEARGVAATVKEIWDKRRVITEEVTEACIKMVIENGYDKHSAIAIGSPDFGHGIVGIVAARVVDKFHKPVCVFGHEGRGSLRGPAGSRLYDALTFCSSSLLKFGGHQLAAGAQLSWDRLDAFRSSFREFHEQNPFTPSNSEENLFLDLDLRDSLEQVEKDLYLLEPTGQGNPKPRIRVKGILKSGKEVKGAHGKFDLVMENHKTLPCFIISRGPEIPGWIGKRMSVVGDLRKNEWRGKTTIELFVEEVALLA